MQIISGNLFVIYCWLVQIICCIFITDYSGNLFIADLLRQTVTVVHLLKISSGNLLVHAYFYCNSYLVKTLMALWKCGTRFLEPDSRVESPPLHSVGSCHFGGWGVQITTTYSRDRRLLGSFPYFALPSCLPEWMVQPVENWKLAKRLLESILENVSLDCFLCLPVRV